MALLTIILFFGGALALYSAIRGEPFVTTLASFFTPSTPDIITGGKPQ